MCRSANIHTIVLNVKGINHALWKGSSVPVWVKRVAFGGSQATTLKILSHKSASNRRMGRGRRRPRAAHLGLLLALESQCWRCQADQTMYWAEATELFPAPRQCASPASERRSICTVAVLHFRKAETAVEGFEVGFRKAVDHLERSTELRFTWVNLAALEGINTPAESMCTYLQQFDHYWVKSNWEWLPDKLARMGLKGCPVSRSLLISGNWLPPDIEALHFYDVLYYETFWYHAYAALHRHPIAVHAFGIDTDIMNRTTQGIPEIVEPEWDFLLMSNIAYYTGAKKTYRIADKPGRRLLIGRTSGAKAQEVAQELEERGVTVRDMVPYSQLAHVIASAAAVYVPDEVLGGGERAVLEARALGVGVELEGYNPKLMELLESPIYDHVYYAQQLLLGLEALDVKLARENEHTADRRGRVVRESEA